MSNIDVLFFDVLGTMVDWRGSIAAETRAFLERNGRGDIDPAAFADAWVGRYDASVEPVRSGERPFVPLDQVNRENLEATLGQFGLAPAAFPPGELEELNLAWHRLRAWPDLAEGLSRLRSRFIVAPLSDGHTRLLVNVSRHNGLSWDAVVGADIARTYKPVPRAYLGACELLGVRPGNAMLVAAHGYDLEAARTCGLKTAHVARSGAADPSKAGSEGARDGWDYSCRDLLDLAGRLGA